MTILIGAVRQPSNSNSDISVATIGIASGIGGIVIASVVGALIVSLSRRQVKTLTRPAQEEYVPELHNPIRVVSEPYERERSFTHPPPYISTRNVFTPPLDTSIPVRNPFAIGTSSMKFPPTTIRATNYPPPPPPPV